jgi:dihydrofolate synthase/folylpolyglutamate synthase
VVDPKVSVITDIALDHQKFLGETIAEIAREKAGIIQRHGLVVTLPQIPAANDVIGNAILQLDATAVSAVPYVPPVSPAAPDYFKAKPFTTDSTEAIQRRTGAFSRYPLQVMGKQILVETPLVGRHQLRNVALAIAAAEELSKQGFAITPETIERGIRDTQWPGRFQIVPGTPEIVLDVAHNPAGAWALRSALSTYYEDRRIIFVFGAMRDKAIGEIADILFPLAESVVATVADNPRSATPEEIRAAASRTGAEIVTVSDVASALERARALAKTDGVVVVTGSIYIVGEAMRALGIKTLGGAADGK